MAQKVYLKKSSVVDKTPSVNSMDFGELGINYASGNGKSFLLTKKYDGSYAKFHEDSYNTATFATKGDVSNISSTLNSLTGTVQTINNNYASKTLVGETSARTVNAAYNKSSGYTNEQISALSATVKNNYALQSSVSNIESKLSNFALSSTVKTQLSAITVTIEDDEYVIAQTFNNVNDRISALENLSGTYLTTASASSILSDVNLSISNVKQSAITAYKYADAISATVKANYATITHVNETSARTYNKVTAFTDSTYLKITSAASIFQNIENSVSNVNNKLTGFSATVISDYATDTKASSYAAAALANAMEYTDSKVSGLSIGDYITSADAVSKFSEIDLAILNAGNSAKTAYKYAEAISGTVKAAYWDSATTQNKIAAASSATLTAAKGYADDNFVKNGTYNSFTSTTNNSISILAKSAMTVSANVIALSGVMVSRLSSVYRYKGSKANASQLPTTGNEDGDVWNVVAASGNTPAGTNYAWVKEGTSGHWDALGGTIDLSNYYTTGEAATLKSDLENADSDLLNKINAVSGTVKATYWSSATTKSKIDEGVTTAITSAITKSTGYTKSMIDAVSGTVNGYKSDNDSFHSSIRTGLSAWTYNSAATHNEVKAASGNAVTSAKLYTDSQLTAYTQTANANFVTNDRFGAYSSSTLNEINNIKTNYALSSTVKTAITNINDTIEENEAVTSAALTDLDSRIKTVSSTTSGLVTYTSASTMYTNISNSINGVNNKLTGFSATVVNTYATKSVASGYAVSALTQSKEYTDSKISGLSIGNYLTVTSASNIVTQLSNEINKAKTSANSAFNYTAAVSATVRDTYASITHVNETSARTYNKVTAWTETRYITSANAVTAINGLSNSIDNVNTKLTGFSATVMSEYATETEASSYAAAALGNAMAYTDSKISGLSIGNYLTVTSANSIVTTLSNSVNQAKNAANSAFNYTAAVSATVNSNFATKDLLNTTSGNAVTAAKNYADGKFLTTTSASNIVTTLNNSINGVKTAANSAFNYTAAVSATVNSNFATKDLLNTTSGNAVNAAKNYADGKFLTTTSASNIVTTINNSINGVKTTANSAFNYTAAVSATVNSSFATKDLLNTTSGNAVTAAKNYADGKFLTTTSASSIVTTLNNSINGVDTKVEALSSSVITNYATDAKASSYAAAALGDSMDYTDSKIAGLSIGNYLTVTSAESIVTTFSNSINGIGTAFSAFSGNVINKISTVYTYKGSVQSCANLPSSHEVGDTYNVVNASGNTPAGTNWAWNGSGWDPLAGTVDLSPFFTKESAGTMYDMLTNQLSNVALSGTVKDEITAINNTITDNEEVTSAALNDLNTRYTNMNQLVSTFTSRFFTIASATTTFNNITNELATVNTLAESAYTYADTINTNLSTYATHTEVGTASANSIAIAAGSAITQADGKYATITTVNGISSDVNILKQSAATLNTKFVAKAGDTMTGHLNFNTASTAYGSTGLRWATNKAGIGADSNGGLGVYANGNIYLRPSNQFASSTSGLVIASTGLTFNNNNVYHAGNLSPVTLNTVQTIASAKTFTQAITANGGLTLQTAATFSNVYRAVPFSDTVSPYNNIRYVNTNANSGLTYNPFTGKLRAYGFIINGKAATDLLNATGGTTSSAGFVPTGRTVNGHALSANVTVSKADVGLGNVDNIAQSAWTGNTKIASVGTITAGTWNGTKIANAYLANNAVAIDGQVVALGTSATTKNVAQTGNATNTNRPLLMGAATGSTATAATLTAATTSSTYTTTKASINPSTGVITAGGFALTASSTNILLANGSSIAQSTFATTDKKVGQASSTAAERRALILGTTTAATGTALATTAVTGETAFNKDIYAIPSTGELNAKQMRINEKVTLQYNSTTEALDFIFS